MTNNQLLSVDKSLFNFKTQVRVRNYEVDWQGIVHNANYVLYFEVGRMEYLKQLDISVDFHSIRNDGKVVLVRNEINYKSPAKYDEVLNVFTRVAKIDNTSFVFEGMIEEEKTQRLIADNIAYHVWLEPNSNEPITVPNDFREKVKQFEK
jgi:acyl-CoA thioester hydrolase